MKLTANTPLKVGTKEGIVEVAENESFEVDKKTGDALVASGAAYGGSAKSAKDEAEKSNQERQAREDEITDANRKAAEEAAAGKKAQE